MTIEWNRVTWYSKLLAVIVFVATFWIAFCLGVHWEQAQIGNSLMPTSSEEIPDDNGIGEGPAVVGAGEHCGGFIKDAPVCAKGLHCQLKVGMPDTGGTCVADSTSGPEQDTEVVMAKLNQSVKALGVTLTPLEVLDDSRCPKDVQCIWAGTVNLRVRVQSGLGTSEQTIKLGEHITTEAERIDFTDVSPAHSSTGPISPSQYQFTFEVGQK